MTVITLVTAIDLMSGLRYTGMSQSRHCKVKLSALKSIVNKLSCPKCQGEFQKSHVANVADLFNASI